MKIVHPNLENEIILNNKNVAEWIIESPELFSQYLLELSSQINGADGKFVLSNKGFENDVKT